MLTNDETRVSRGNSGQKSDRAIVRIGHNQIFTLDGLQNVSEYAAFLGVSVGNEKNVLNQIPLRIVNHNGCSRKCSSPRLSQFLQAVVAAFKMVAVDHATSVAGQDRPSFGFQKRHHLKTTLITVLDRSPTDVRLNAFELLVERSLRNSNRLRQFVEGLIGRLANTQDDLSNCSGEMGIQQLPVITSLPMFIKHRVEVFIDHRIQYDARHHNKRTSFHKPIQRRTGYQLTSSMKCQGTHYAGRINNLHSL